MSLMADCWERVGVVSSNAVNLCALLNVADEQHFLQNYMSPDVFQECIAGDTNMARIQILCENMVHDIMGGNLQMYNALSEYFLRRSETYKDMYHRFTAIGSTNASDSSINATSELLILQEKVKALTQEVLQLRQSHTTANCQSESIIVKGLFDESETASGCDVNVRANGDPVTIGTMEVDKFQLEAAFFMGPQLSPSQVCVKTEFTEIDVNPVTEEIANAGNVPGVIFMTEQCTENDGGELRNTTGNSSQIPYQCEHCEKTFRWKSHLIEHVRIHTDEKPFACEDCGKKFRWKHCLVNHARVHTSEAPYKCEHCDKKFKGMKNLVLHVRVHTGEKPFVCEHCGKVFSQKSHLVQHVRLHTGDNTFACEHCGKVFGQKTHLVQHVRLHTGEKPFTCDHCGKLFSQKSHLVQHVRLHTGDNTFACEHCGKVFGQKTHLVQHIRIHTGEKPFACEHCGKVFGQKSHLVQHVRLHTGDNTFACEQCGKVFGQKSHLVQHIRIHTGEKKVISE